MTSLPNSIQAEKALLGCLLMDADMIPLAGGMLSPTDFYHEYHKSIYTGMIEITASGQGVDILTVSDWLGKHTSGNNDHNTFLIDLMGQVPNTLHTLDYARIIQEYSGKRQAWLASSQLATQAQNGAAIEDMLGEMEKNIVSIRRRLGGSVPTIQDQILDYITLVDERIRNPVEFTGLPSPFRIAKKYDLFQRGEIIGVIGRPKMGKTALALTIADTWIAASINTVIFSMEMKARQIINRLLARRCNVTTGAILKGGLTHEQYDNVMVEAMNIKNSRLTIDDTSLCSPSYIRSRLTQIEMERGPIEAVIIDYIGLMKMGKESSNKADALDDLTRDIKAIAKDFNCCIVLLSQVNRESGKTQSKVPQLDNMRGGDGLSNNAWAILAPVRMSYYDELSDPKRADVHIIAHRDGETGSFPVFWREYSASMHDGDFREINL